MNDEAVKTSQKVLMNYNFAILYAVLMMCARRCHTIFSNETRLTRVWRCCDTAYTVNATLARRRLIIKVTKSALRSTFHNEFQQWQWAIGINSNIIINYIMYTITFMLTAAVKIQGGPKNSKPLSLIIIKSN